MKLPFAHWKLHFIYSYYQIFVIVRPCLLRCLWRRGHLRTGLTPSLPSVLTFINAITPIFDWLNILQVMSHNKSAGKEIMNSVQFSILYFIFTVAPFVRCVRRHWWRRSSMGYSCIQNNKLEVSLKHYRPCTARNMKRIFSIHSILFTLIKSLSANGINFWLIELLMSMFLMLECFHKPMVHANTQRYQPSLYV